MPGPEIWVLLRACCKPCGRGAERETVTPRCFVIVYAALGEQDQAFYWLDRAFEAHDPYLFFLRVNALYDPLRSDPRFDETLRQFGIPGK